MGDDEQETDGTAQSSVDLVNDGEITTCTHLPYQPFQFERGGEIVGFDVDMIDLAWRRRSAPASRLCRRGQMEAARSLGMSHGRALVSIVIPQAFRIILPPLTNEPILVGGLAYLIITVPLGYVVRRLEPQQAKAR